MLLSYNLCRCSVQSTLVKTRRHFFSTCWCILQLLKKLSNSKRSIFYMFHIRVYFLLESINTCYFMIFDWLMFMICYSRYCMWGEYVWLALLHAFWKLCGWTVCLFTRLYWQTLPNRHWWVFIKSLPSRWHLWRPGEWLCVSSWPL